MVASTIILQIVFYVLAILMLIAAIISLFDGDWYYVFLGIVPAFVFFLLALSFDDYLEKGKPLVEKQYQLCYEDGTRFLEGPSSDELVSYIDGEYLAYIYSDDFKIMWSCTDDEMHEVKYDAKVTPTLEKLSIIKHHTNEEYEEEGTTIETKYRLILPSENFLSTN